MLKVDPIVADRSFPEQTHPWRWVIGPTALGVFGVVAGFVTAAASRLLRRTREPVLPRMSDRWLRTHDSEHQIDNWRDSW